MKKGDKELYGKEEGMSVNNDKVDIRKKYIYVRETGKKQKYWIFFCRVSQKT